MYPKLLLIICCWWAWQPVAAQIELITLDKSSGRVEIPFEYINNFIVVQVVFNKVFPLKFIFDTGAENTILTHKEITDLLQVDYQRKISIYGSDLKTELLAYVAAGISMEFGEHLRLSSQSILVLEEDYFRFEEYVGTEIHGILGADILRRFVIEIDFRRRVISFQDPSRFTPPNPKKFFQIPVEFDRYKPYLTLPANLIQNQPTSLKLLMDSGASLALLLYTHSDSLLQLPENLIRTNIGHGLGGALEGYVGRTATLQIGKIQLNQVITSFHDLDQDYDIDNTFLNSRNGLLGNNILSRFSVIIDYIREKVYLRPNRDYNRPFKYDRSGLTVIAAGGQQHDFVILNVVKDSPADLAGLQKGDEIRALNGVPSILLGLENLVSNFQRKVGKRVRLLIKRGEQRMLVEFRLQDII
ncbi:MAG: hypothetical protein DA408_15545 [Bacteroidetes bacterium]|nr:MAG: hypothetical protein C7N36_11870 [Bacteroidota bacterium]PTM10661.1 MAG: hypothetical protein DA408_15545 [Bacteroidota bacterium]